MAHKKGDHYSTTIFTEGGKRARTYPDLTKLEAYELARKKLVALGERAEGYAKIVRCRGDVCTTVGEYELLTGGVLTKRIC
jgi:hypothetical protein